MAQITRTLNPLPFTDLEPRRFEDLIRQLVYDFRTWRALEATGRAGSDDGFDARGWEIVTDVEVGTSADSDDDEQESTTAYLSDRKWLIQCKRERSIGPTKIENYIDEINRD